MNRIEIDEDEGAPPEGSIFKTKARHDEFMMKKTIWKIECPCGGKVIQFPKMEELKERSGRAQCMMCKTFKD